MAAPRGVEVSCSDGSTARYDLLAGADGVHSQVRALAFGDEARFTRFLGYYSAAFILAAPPGRMKLDALYTMTRPSSSTRRRAAASCARQGASMAMAGAFVLAEELQRAPDLAQALRRYEARLKPAIEKKQRAGRRIARWFVPGNRLRLALNDLVTRMAEWPLSWRLVRRALAPWSVLR